MKNVYCNLIIAALLVMAPCAAFSQSIPAKHLTIAYQGVVNLVDIANTQPQQHRPQPQLPTVLSAENNSAGSGNQQGNSAAHQVGSSSYTASPMPIANFSAQNYDGHSPPYPYGAVNDSFLVSTTRYTIQVQNRTGAVLASADLGYFWADSVPIDYIWQNQVAYDPSIQRWILGAFGDQNTDTACVLVGISQTSDPTGNWNLYKVRADSSARTYSSNATLGFNKTWIAISGVNIDIDSTTSDTTAIYVFDKNAMINRGPINCSHFKTFSARGSLAKIYDTTMENLYFLVEWTANNGTLNMEKISGAVGSETLTEVAYPSSGVAHAPNPLNYENFAPQAGNPTGLQTGNDAAVSAVFINGNLWTAQTIFLPSGSNPTRSSILWWQIDTSGNVLQNGLIDDTTGANFFAYPSIAVNQYDDALIGFAAFSGQQFPSAGYSYHDHSAGLGTTDSFYVYKYGLATYLDTAVGGSNYWAGWSATVLDPLDFTGFWTIQSYSTAGNQWGTWWANVDNPPSGINNTKAPKTSVKIFPNPNTGAFNIAVNNLTLTGVNIKMFDLLGREVFTQTTQAGAGSSIISVSTQGLSKGIYMAEIKIAGQTLMQKVVIE